MGVIRFFLGVRGLLYFSQEECCRLNRFFTLSVVFYRALFWWFFLILLLFPWVHSCPRGASHFRVYWLSDARGIFFYLGFCTLEILTHCRRLLCSLCILLHLLLHQNYRHNPSLFFLSEIGASRLFHICRGGYLCMFFHPRNGTQRVFIWRERRC